MVQIAMLAGLPHTALHDAMPTHPTLVEELIPLFTAVPSVKSADAKVERSKERKSKDVVATAPGRVAQPIVLRLFA